MAISISSTLPIPSHLRDSLPYPETPWRISEDLFKRVRNQPSHPSSALKSCVVSKSDPEFEFILKYFMQSKPPGYAIKSMSCIHNPPHTKSFESSLENAEQEAKNSSFSPKGKEENPPAERQKALERWQRLTALFSPLEIESSTSRRKDRLLQVKVVPLWHGTRKEVCQSICESGFTYFGKHDYFFGGGSSAPPSTDIGYFGSGIYFTDSAEYAAKYDSGYLLLAWVSMREPYPVVSDVPHPIKCTDMEKLEGRGHYQNYNTHFIPVASIQPHNPYCLEYYPCYQNQTPDWDEFVVFQKAQTLARFWIELGSDAPQIPLASQGEDEYQLALKEKSPTQAFLAYQSAAQKGHPLAQIALGNCFLNGTGVPPNLSEAIKWYREAAKQGEGEAYYQLAVCYHQGKGVPQDYPLARYLLQKAASFGYAPATSLMKNGFYTDLWMASQLGGIDYIRQQIEQLHPSQVSKAVNDKNGEGKAPLHLAAFHKQVEVTQFLLDHKADPILPDHDGYQPLHWAAKGGSVPIVVELLKWKAPINAPGLYGRTPLHMAVFNSQELVVEELLKQGAHINAQTNKEDFLKTPLHDAVIHLDERMVQILVRSSSLDVNMKDIDGHTPLYHAVLEGHLEIIRWIMNHPSWNSHIDSKDPNHLSQLIQLQPRHNADAVKEFLKKFLP